MTPRPLISVTRQEGGSHTDCPGQLLWDRLQSRTASIAAIGAVLSAFVAWIFARLGPVGLAVAFGVVAVISLVILGWALYRGRRGAQQRQDRRQPRPASGAAGGRDAPRQ